MRDILFMGTIIASVTHDMQNIMAIIKESGALTDDILSMNGSPKMRHSDKLAVAQRNIQEQVLRGRDLMLMLNGFAHAAADYPLSSDITRFVRQISLPAERLYRLKQCALYLDVPTIPLPVQGNALMLMQTVYTALRTVLADCAAGDSVTLTVRPNSSSGATDDAGALVRIRAQISRAVPDAAEIIPMMQNLGGSCRAEEGLLKLTYSQACTTETEAP